MSKEGKAPDQIVTALSKEDVKFISEKSTFLKEASNMIGMRKYESLCSKRQSANNFKMTNPFKTNPFTLSATELQQIADFEEKRKIDPKANEKMITHWERLYAPRNDFNKKGLDPTKKLLYHAFKIMFENLYGKPFEENEDTLRNLGAVINYFAKNKDFFNSTTIVKKVDGKILVNNFKKGLLIFGDYGCGKSSILEVMSKVIDHYYSESYTGLWDSHILWRNIRFKYAACWQLVTEFEGLTSPDERVLWTDKYTVTKCCFDDLTKENPASNYGVKNLMQNVIEIRYDKRVTTHATMNYDPKYPNNIAHALNQIGIRYGGHNYDRVKEMFNILEFKGKSFRE